MTARRLELYGSRSCPHTADLREHLEWRNESFVEYDVDLSITHAPARKAAAPGRSAM